MKKEYFVQHCGKELPLTDVDNQVKNVLVEKGIKMKDVNNIASYIKAENYDIETYVVVELKDGKTINLSF